jgi:RNA-directed DNA polymerase
MLSALENGVKGGKWYSLIDKAYAPATPGTRLDEGRGEQRRGGRGWAKRGSVRSAGGCVSVRAEHGRAGGQLPSAPVKRVEIPKGDGRTARLEDVVTG